MPSLFSSSSRSSALRLVAASAVTLLALTVCHPLSAALAQSVTADECLRDPAAAIELPGFGRYENGAVLRCPTSGGDQLRAAFYGAAADSTADNLPYRASSSYSLCKNGGACLVTGSLRPNGGPALHLVTLTTAGAYTLQVVASTSPRTGGGALDPFTCALYDSRQCVQRCRSCTQTVAVTCYYNDPVGLQMAQDRATPKGGAGSNAGSIAASALVNGAPFAASSFGASLPLRAGATLHPRCKLESLTFGRPYGPAGSPTLVIPLPAGGSDEVVIRDCASITPEQVALITAASSLDAPSEATYLSLGAPLLCEDVRSAAAAGPSGPTIDARVTSYAFGGDLRVASPVRGAPSTGNVLVCGDARARGPIAALPAAGWRSASFAVTAAHTTRFSLCDDDSCIGGNADGACSACSYTYRVRFACDEQPPVQPEHPGGGGGGIVGDPQFVGLRGQSYQVHGVSGEVYNIVSSPSLQYNARFVFLSSGACPTVDGRVQRKGCYSHPGSYLGELGLKTAGGDLMRIEAGGAKQGFAAVTFNERELAVGETALLADGAGFIARNSSHVVSVTAGQWEFVFDNSDRFINQRVAVSGDVAALRSHGLLGQTWRERTYPHAPIKCIQGTVDDYVIREKDVFGDEFAFNAFN